MFNIILGIIISFMIGVGWYLAIQASKELLNTKTWNEYNELISQAKLELNIFIAVFRVIIRLPIIIIMLPILIYHVIKLKRESE